MTAEKRTMHKWMVWAAIVSAVVFLLSPLIIFRCKHHADVNRRIEDLAAAGFPVSMSDLEQRYVLPAGVDNAADTYLEAFRWYADPNETERELLPVRGNYILSDDMPPYPPEVMAAIESSLENNQRCLELLDKAARIERCLMPRTKNGIWFSNDYLSELKRAAQLLSERNLYLAQTQQTDALLESLKTSIALTRCLSEQPFLIDQLVSIALQAMTAADIERSLYQTQFSDEQLALLQQEFRRLRDQNMMAEAMINERAVTLEILRMSSAMQFRDFGYGLFGNFLDQPLFVLYSISGLKYKDAALLLEFAEQAIAACQLPPHEQMVIIDGSEMKFKYYSSVHWLLHAISPSYRYSKFNMRVMGNLLCTETAWRLKRYRLVHQSLPNRWTRLCRTF
jgi:hypothetical protein